MGGDEHRRKAAALAAAVAHLDVPSDYELVLEGQMHRATHLVNALLHESGTTPEQDDLLHVDMPRSIDPPTHDLMVLMDCLRECEQLRCLHVRGGLTMTAAVDAALARIDSVCAAHA